MSPMRFALFRASVPVKALYYATEGHGFYREEHRREYYTRLLASFALEQLAHGLQHTP